MIIPRNNNTNNDQKLRKIYTLNGDNIRYDDSSTDSNDEKEKM